MNGLGTILVFSCGMTAAIVGIQQPKAEGPKVNPEALVLQDFQHRIDQYMDLHKRLEKQSPPLKEADDPARIKASQEALAKAIRDERADAKPGDIFSPEIAERLRALIHPQVAGAKGAQTKAAIKEDAPPPIVLKVNGSYPEQAPLPSVPPNVLANLPQLPKDLEFRIVGNDLILRDVHANLIVDFMRHALR